MGSIYINQYPGSLNMVKSRVKTPAQNKLQNQILRTYVNNNLVGPVNNNNLVRPKTAKKNRSHNPYKNLIYLTDIFLLR